MAPQTFVEADIWTVAQTDQGNVVLVRPKGSDLAVPIFIGQLETQSILIGMGKVDVPRPLTHDLAISLIRTFGAEVSKIEINDLREGTFFARMVLKAGERDMIVDSRPSDAIGIAVRVGCPVFIAESVVEEAGISVNLVTGEQNAEGEASEHPSSPPLVLQPGDELARLKTELEEAISEEDYERAAILRDRIKELEGGL
jgi:bifunctional DNase/RNase